MEVGDYVRTEKGTITKFNIHDILLNKFENRYYYTYDTCCEDSVSELVIKSSPNIMDLIEVGDYVNGCLIVEISKDPFIKGQINLWTNMIISEGEPFPNEYYKAKILEKDIKSIVTKEMYSSVEYRVENN